MLYEELIKMEKELGGQPGCGVLAQWTYDAFGSGLSPRGQAPASLDSLRASVNALAVEHGAAIMYVEDNGEEVLVYVYGASDYCESCSL